MPREQYFVGEILLGEKMGLFRCFEVLRRFLENGPLVFAFNLYTQIDFDIKKTWKVKFIFRRRYHNK